MAKFTVLVPVEGFEVHEIDADSIEQARELVLDGEGEKVSDDIQWNGVDVNVTPVSDEM